MVMVGLWILTQETPLGQRLGGQNARAPWPVWGPWKGGSLVTSNLVELNRAEHINTLREQLLDVAQEVGVHWGTGRGGGETSIQSPPCTRQPLSIPQGASLISRPGCVAGCIAALLPGAAVHGEGPLAGVTALGLADTLFVQEPHLVVEGDTAEARVQGTSSSPGALGKG